MQRVFSNTDLGQATLIKDVLEKEGIPCMIKNEVVNPANIFGFTDAWPEVWIMNDDDLKKALQIVQDWSPQNR